MISGPDGSFPLELCGFQIEVVLVACLHGEILSPLVGVAPWVGVSSLIRAVGIVTLVPIARVLMVSGALLLLLLSRVIIAPTLMRRPLRFP
jgi:hypothetical protein